MPFNIEWVDNSSGVKQTFSVHTPAGRLALTLQQDVIVDMNWLQAGASYNGAEEIDLFELSQYWQNPDAPITVKLLKQGTPYRRQVWSALCQIPLGEVRSYSDIAKSISSAARPVGNACRDNPYPLFIPCHRVVSTKNMGGYCGKTNGEFMLIKFKLLDFEAHFIK